MEIEMNNDAIMKELQDIKKLLILQLIVNGVPVQNVAKASGMSTKTLYKFIPKSLGKNTIK